MQFKFKAFNDHSMKRKTHPFSIKTSKSYADPGVRYSNFYSRDQRSLTGFKQHSPAGQHHVPIQQVHHLSGKEVVDSVLVYGRIYVNLLVTKAM